MELISALVGCHDVHKEDVFGLFVKSHNPDFEGGEHTPMDTKEKNKNKNSNH